MSKPLTGPCVIWRGAANAEGYPTFGSRLAHRAAYGAMIGPIPPGHVLHHDCENKRCINAAHLTPMTAADHMRLHRSWEQSAKARVQRETCRLGHPLDGRQVIAGRERRFCRECKRADVRERYARNRRLEPLLPKSPLMAAALARDEQAPTGIDGDEPEGDDDAAE